MITVPTVFILGAGASCPYGFPSGAKLKSDICEGLVPPNTVGQDLSVAGFGKSEIEIFRIALQRSGKMSVDAFLEHQPVFHRIGKAAIAACLLRRENLDAVFAMPDGDWLHLVLDAMNANAVQFAENAVTFITYNYDRVVEAFFLHSVYHGYNRESFDDAWKISSRIPVIHLHGSFGNVWGENAVPFEPELSPVKLHSAASKVRIIHEEDSYFEDASFIAARTAIASAKRIFILGFGFAAENINRLFPDRNVLKGINADATALGLFENEIITYRKRLFGREWGKFSTNFRFCDTDCRNLLRANLDRD